MDPLGYKPKGKSSFSAHQVSFNDKSNSDVAVNGSEQFQQILAMLAPHLSQSSNSNATHTKSVGHVESGIVLSTHNSISLANVHWIIDSSASCHICFDIHQFSDIRPVQHLYVTLPHRTYIPMHFVSNIKFSTHFSIDNVYYIPNFKVNLIFVSAFLKSSNLSMIFDSTSLLI